MAGELHMTKQNRSAALVTSADERSSMMRRQQIRGPVKANHPQSAASVVVAENRTNPREARAAINRSQQQQHSMYQNETGMSAMKPPVATKLSQRTDERMISITNAHPPASEEGTSNFMTPKRTWQTKAGVSDTESKKTSQQFNSANFYGN